MVGVVGFLQQSAEAQSYIRFIVISTTGPTLVPSTIRSRRQMALWWIFSCNSWFFSLPVRGKVQSDICFCSIDNWSCFLLFRQLSCVIWWCFLYQSVVKIPFTARRIQPETGLRLDKRLCTNICQKDCRLVNVDLLTGNTKTVISSRSRLPTCSKELILKGGKQQKVGERQWWWS